ncbi:MAG TPA: type I-U CRISPR-associated protein Csx17 [Candidatus Xenobia bacterium]|jgi:CRISPR-associated protein Csx17
MKLTGCAPQPLAHYLKALGILRLAAEQLDPKLRGSWAADGFVLAPDVDLEQFLLEAYEPTPIVAPWNGGSGFAPKDNQDGIVPLRESKETRLAPYREAIEAGFRERNRLGIKDKPDDLKEKLIASCRAWFPDRALAWLDAALVLTTGGLAYPPILGTGGNDGRLDFSNNFMQRIVELFKLPKDTSRRLLRAALWGEAQPGFSSVSVGQFLPGGAGGMNQSTGFEGGSLINPWDFVLMLEGTLLFAAAATRRLERERPSAVSCPFHVRTVGAGYGSAATADEGLTRSEIWAPLWEAPTMLAELKTLFAEGRAQVGERMAVNGVDFARAVSTLGVDRGLSTFVRYGFLERNGQAYLAVPLGEYRVSRRPEVELLDSLDPWLERLRSKASGDKAPASVRRAVRTLEEAILALCRQGHQRLEDVFLAVGQCERAISRSLKWARESFVEPCPPLPIEWLPRTPSVEGRLAIALASTAGLRGYLEPVVVRGDKAWFEDVPSNDVIGLEGTLADRLLEILQRKLIATSQKGEAFQLWAARRAALSDVDAFIERRTRDDYLAELLWSLSLLRWPRGEVWALRGDDDLMPGATYGLLKLCFSLEGLPMMPELIYQAAAGDSLRATEVAVRRLRGSGFVSALHHGISVSRSVGRRSAAAVIFPISRNDENRLMRALHIHKEEESHDDLVGVGQSTAV